MHRITTKRVPVLVAACALLTSAAVLATGNFAGAQPQIDAEAICNAGPPAQLPAGFTELIVGTPEADNLKGGSGNDLIFGLGGNDIIKGGGGDDILCGGAGDDILKGGSGTNHLVGGAGVDTYKGGSGTDYVYRQPADKPTKGLGGTNIDCPTNPDVCM